MAGEPKWGVYPQMDSWMKRKTSGVFFNHAAPGSTFNTVSSGSFIYITINRLDREILQPVCLVWLPLSSYCVIIVLSVINISRVSPSRAPDRLLNCVLRNFVFSKKGGQEQVQRRAHGHCPRRVPWRTAHTHAHTHTHTRGRARIQT